MKRSSLKGFTLLELLVVISIIVILASIVMPALHKARTRAYVTKTKAVIAGLELALSMYEADCGVYPGVDGVEEPMKAIWFVGNSEILGWNGPYAEFKEKELSDDKIFVIDSWGKPLRYTKAPSHRAKSYEIISTGPDQIAGNDDDISNYMG